MKNIRLIELFAGIGSQAMALRDIGADFESYRVVEFDKYAIQSYNAIHGTNFPTMDITKINAEDLGIVETDKYNYIMTYSFPCQDLSVAGKQQGMTKGSGTRSGLLWEVERLLKELYKTNGGGQGLPQFLLMENVTQVHGKKNVDDFNDWLGFLESLGYKNYYQDLNAKDYSIPQNRNRCFMVSILDGRQSFVFPKPQDLEHPMRDFLESEVDEKYYLSDKMLNGFLKHNEIHEIKGTGFIWQPTNPDGVAKCLRANGALCPTDNTIEVVEKHDKKIDTVIVTHQGKKIEKQTDVATCLLARDYKGLGNQQGNAVIEKRCRQVGLVDIGKYRSINAVYSPEACCPTLDTMQGGQRQPKILEPQNVKVHKVFDIPKEVLNDNERQRRVYASDGLTPAILTRSDNAEIIENPFRIRKLTPRECWRLMGFTDADFNKANAVCSNTQLYKQAGNSIVKNVLMAIFKNLI